MVATALIVSILWISDPAAIRAECGPTAAGCFRWRENVCVVYAPDPPLYDDGGKLVYLKGQWGTLGHEVKHCFDGKFHGKGARL